MKQTERRTTPRAEIVARWSVGRSPAFRRGLEAAVARIEAMEAKHGHKYNAPLLPGRPT